MSYEYEFNTYDNLETEEFAQKIAAATSFEQFISLILLPEKYAEIRKSIREHFRREEDFLLFAANLAINYATYDTRERNAYGVGCTWHVDLLLATAFFDLRDKLTDSDCPLCCDVESTFSWSSPWATNCYDALSYALEILIFDLHNDEGAFSVVNTDVDAECQQQIHDTLTWLKGELGYDVVKRRLAAVTDERNNLVGPFVIEPWDDDKPPFQLPCVTRWFANPDAPFEVTPDNEPTPFTPPVIDPEQAADEVYEKLLSLRS